MTKKLRIAMLGSNFIRIPPEPPEKYVAPGASGAPEIIIHQLTELLVSRGHDVTLFASGDSATKARLQSVTEESTWFSIGRGPHLEYERLLISHLYQQAHQFDIIHSHFDIQSAYFAPLVKTPTIQTLHSPLEGLTKDILSYYKEKQYYASISKSQRTPLPDLQYIGTIPNGIDTENIPFGAASENYLVHAGRIVPDKGTKEAIHIARLANTHLLLFGSADETTEYWQKEVKPGIDGKQIEYKGIINRNSLFQYFSKAKAFIFPIQWEEPFGLAMIEAMACGTPVIALRRGAVPEIIIDGKTGFIVDTLNEMVEAIQKVDSIDRSACRRHVEENFSIKKMVDNYEQAYYDIVARQHRV